MCFFCCDSSGPRDPSSSGVMCTMWPSIRTILTCSIRVRAKYSHKFCLDIMFLLTSQVICMEPPGISPGISMKDCLWLPLCKWGLWLSFCGNFLTIHKYLCNAHWNQLYLTLRDWNMSLSFCLMQLLFNEVTLKICSDHIWVKYQSCWISNP